MAILNSVLRRIRLGQVADNANISSAVNPKWRTAKTHVSTSIFTFQECIGDDST